MKNILLLFTLFFAVETYSQDNGVRSLWNVQTGLIGAWISYEQAVQTSLTVKGAMGLSSDFTTDYRVNNELIFSPEFSLQPRWYYNIVKRGQEGKRVSNNSANYLGLAFTYKPDWFELPQENDIVIESRFKIMPSWNLRRNIGSSNFNYEIGAGLGYRFVFNESEAERNQSAVIFGLNARIGYCF